MNSFSLMNNKKMNTQINEKISVDKNVVSGVAFAHLLNTGNGGNHTREFYMWNFLCPEFEVILGVSGNIQYQGQFPLTVFKLPELLFADYLNVIKEIHHV